MKPRFAKPMVITATMLVSSTLSLAITLPAQAASFTPFPFTTNVTASPSPDPTSVLLNDPTKDIRLDSVVFGGNTISQFELVNEATILQNDTYTATNGNVYGILNSGRGPNTASDPLIGEGPSNPVGSSADIVGSLGNLNLNSLVVTRESAPTATIEVSFENPVDTFFFWERGGTPGGSVAGDSDLLVEALSDDGSTVLATYKILRANYTKADYNISSQVAPILNNGPFNIGSIGLNLDGITTKTLRLTSSNNNDRINGDNGPDFKVVAAQVVPEPSIIAGLVVVGGLGAIQKRKKAASN